jgi:hypothetical protein
MRPPVGNLPKLLYLAAFLLFLAATIGAAGVTGIYQAWELPAGLTATALALLLGAL